MSTLRSQATAESRQGFFGRMFNAHGRAVRKAVVRARKGHEAPFEHLDNIPAARRALAFLAVGEQLRDSAPEQAFLALERALALDFTSIAACVHFGQLARQTHRLAPGIAACRRLLAQTPSQIPVLAELAHLLVLDGDPRAALGVLAEADTSELPILAVREAHALLALGRVEEATKIVQVLVSLAPDGSDDLVSEEARALLAQLAAA